MIALTDTDLTITESTASTGGTGDVEFSDIQTARLVGSPSDNRLDASGFVGNAVLIGGAGDDVLIGGVGNDELDGGGDNELIGGGGDDDYRFGATADGSNVVRELTGGGTDTLDFSLSIQPIAIDLLDDSPQSVNDNLTLTLDVATNIENVLTIEVLNETLRHRVDRVFDSVVRLYGPDGEVVAYYGDETLGAFNDNSFESLDAVLFDFALPPRADGSTAPANYTIEVDTFSFDLAELNTAGVPSYLGDFDVEVFRADNPNHPAVLDNDYGEYELFIYQFDDPNAAPRTDGDTLIGGLGAARFSATQAPKRWSASQQPTATCSLTPRAKRPRKPLSRRSIRPKPTSTSTKVRRCRYNSPPAILTVPQ